MRRTIAPLAPGPGAGRLLRRLLPCPVRVASACAAVASAAMLSLTFAAGASAEGTRETLTAVAEAVPAQATPTRPGHGPTAVATLSNERTLTRWAHPLMVFPIHAAPSGSSRQIANTHLYTEDGFPEVYLLLESLTDSRGREWVKIRVPGRPNGRVGWVLREALGDFQLSRWKIRINRELRRLTAYENGRVRFVFPVGVGKPSTPTPAGRFWIRERFKLTNPSNPYYPWALGTSDYSVLTDWPGGGIVGIHGDFGEPQKIPGDPSHGCVRMRDSDLARLAPLLPLGTPVEIV